MLKFSANFVYLHSQIYKLTNLMSTLNINDNNFLRQFEVNINGQLAKVEYALQERKIFLTKIILPENTTDQFKEDFLVQIFEIIKDRKLRMMPTSSEIKKFLKSNKEYMDLLPIGVRL